MIPFAADASAIQTWGGQAVVTLILGALLVILFHRERDERRRLWREQTEHITSEVEAKAAQTRDKLEDQVALLSEKLDGHLRVLVITDGKAKESLAEVANAIGRVENLEVRLNALEHRLSVTERYQMRVLEAEERVRDEAPHLLTRSAEGGRPKSGERTSAPDTG